MRAVPDDVRRAIEVMAGLDGDWALCGGWSVDAWLGRQTRDHPDVDFAVFEEDQLALRDHFGTGWLLSGHDPDDENSTEPWNGRHLAIPAHVHCRADGYDLDVQLNRRADGDWVFCEQPRIVLPLARCITPSSWTSRTLAPEATLFYKATGEMRPRDAADFSSLLPVLDRQQRGWLRDALRQLYPEHPWIPVLSATD